MKRLLFAILGTVLVASLHAQSGSAVSLAPDLRLIEIGDGVWIHVSTILLEPWGPVDANGLAILTEEGLVLIDTPWTDGQTEVLCRWFQDQWSADLAAAVVTHFHDDNLGGLDWVHRQGHPSYGLAATRDICRVRRIRGPRFSINEDQTLRFGDRQIRVFFPGEGHTSDSCCVYLPDQRILFGGCSVKALDQRNLGNTADANLQAWPDSLRTMKRTFRRAGIVVPGHGEAGGLELVDHTLSMF